MNTIKYKDREYGFILNVNSMDEIQNKLGTFNKWCEDISHHPEPILNSLKIGYTAMINEYIDMKNEENGTNEPFLTERQVGRILSHLSLRVLGAMARQELIDSVHGKDESKNE